MFSKILVPVDGSTEAIEAVKFARKIAEKFSSAVTLIHIIQHAAYIDSDAHSMVSSIIKSLDERGNQVLAQALEFYQDYEGRVATCIEHGHPGVKITEISKEQNYSLIVMGRRGMSDIGKLLIGSVSNYVLHYADCPTLIIRGHK
ncbi:universal stress protein [Propionispora vibrioides]|uniref:Nucleotide-binding universal stress protein, UspA family n=1 Tax=Propionispora vibrioides TaxID=112903 RepID=A0A1H8XCN2_9FIRM|nr:universal stress protein [Propionispora vibrioides]SEP37690.1 Nucleotide-binding universal stress protein, UspA family [Propionispora vibrioides]